MKADRPKTPTESRAWDHIGVRTGIRRPPYRSQGDALTAALVRRQESGVELSVYRCDVCAAWHMGNTVVVAPYEAKGTNGTTLRYERDHRAAHATRSLKNVLG